MKELHSQGSLATTNEMYALGLGPDFRARSYSARIINGVRYHTNDLDSLHRTQNGGLVIEWEHDNQMIGFYGILEDILVVDYAYGY